MAKKIEILPEWPQWKREIAERLNEIGASMKEVSLKAELGETFVRDALKRDKEPAFTNLQKVRKVIGLEERKPILEINGGLLVEGRAQAGAFLDISILDDDHDKEFIPAARDPRFPHAQQYALLIVGDSMNKMFDDGSYVTCVNWADAGLALKPGMCLHVERHQGHLVEVTVKRLSSPRDGRSYLEPCSTNASHKPIEIIEEESSDFIVKGLVIGTWKAITY